MVVGAAVGAFFPWFYPFAASKVGRMFHHDRPINVTVDQKKPNAPSPTLSPTSPPPSVRASPRSIKPGSIAQQVKGGLWNWELCLWTMPSPLGGDSIRALGDIVKRDGANSDPFFHDMHTWVYGHGGADGAVTYFRLTLQGAKHDVVINNIQADIVSRGRPQPGGVFLQKSEGGADVPQRRLELDEPTPKVAYFRDHIVTLEKGEGYAVDVTAFARRYFVVWDLQIDMLVDGEKTTLFIDSEGKAYRKPGAGTPFRTSALLPLDKYAAAKEVTVENTRAWLPLQRDDYDPRGYTDALLNP